MTDTKQTEALRLAIEFADCVELHAIPSINDIAAAGRELRRLHAENTTLQQGYDAARLEIDALRRDLENARHNLRVSQTSFRRAADERDLLLGQQEGVGDYPALPTAPHKIGDINLWPASQMRAYADATCAMRAQADSQPALPKITAEDRSFLHYNPNTDDIVEWVQHYASAAITADRAMRAQAAPADVAVPSDSELDEVLTAVVGDDVYHAEWLQDIGRPCARAVLARWGAAAPQPPAQAQAQEPAASVYTMEALVPGAHAKCHVTLHKPLPAGTKLYTHPAPHQAVPAYQRALDIRTAQGWKLGGDKVPVLYTDTINGEQVCRDDVWLCTTAAFAQQQPAPVAQGDAASTGFFLQLPQRPKPEAPAGTVGLDWDAYSGAQMLAYGRDCSNAAIVSTQKQGCV